MNNCYQVKEQNRFVKYIAEYSNGILTTGGLYKEQELEPLSGIIIGITYNSEACTELPINWHDHSWLDDNNKRQHIKEIRYGEIPAYIMEDGTVSWEVTE